ncbi:hypothetical protein CJF30_00001455 [Rutstroemia sp. NJR-2017a BBW]|nr:hypothetical protein CJF30_00001455 [Rutstroemia sp. NJR-2017a BBW]
MTKDSTADATGDGSHSNVSSRENGLTENASAQPSQTGPSAAAGSRSTQSTSAPTKASEAETPAARDAESQPMTATNSTASNKSSKDVGVSGLGGAAYGTRSRNRTGTARPNYAEDKEMDVDIEIAAAMKEGRKGPRGKDTSTSNPTDNGKSIAAAKQNGAPETEQPAPPLNHNKEQIPGTSTFSANPTTAPSQPSKKRKAPGQSATVAAQPSPPNPPQNGVSAPATTRTAASTSLVGGFRESNMLSFDNCGGRLRDKKLVADDGTVFQVNDHVYLVCEPPGEPYYLGRIMEFLHVNNDPKQRIDALRLNWYYRPKDIGRKVNDTRQVFASMHSDISPLTALRGKCQIKHKAEVEKLDELRKTKDSFWYEKLYDRYIVRFYDVIPVFQVINVPVQVKKVLDERWKYIIVEQGRGKELTSAVKTCKRCSRYCARFIKQACGSSATLVYIMHWITMTVYTPGLVLGLVRATKPLYQRGLADRLNIKKKYTKGGSHRKDSKLSKETVAALEADKIEREKRPPWVMDEPNGYTHRGEDLPNDDPNNTALLQFKIPEVGERSAEPERGMDDNESPMDIPAYEKLVDDYMDRAKKLAKPLGLPDRSTNLLDIALQLLYSNDFDADKALEELSKTDKKVFKEPELSTAELKKFEDGVTKFGSEWYSIKKHVKTMSAADVVRFYYTWKKSDRGKQVWGNYHGRKGKKEAKRIEANLGKLQDDVADDNDDSAFDNDKALEKKRGFQCKFCATRSSRQWRRAPNTPAGTTVPENANSKGAAKEKGVQLVLALCRRCAELWRRYAIQWEDIDDVAKKVATSGGRASKRKIDEELLKELVAVNEVFNHADSVPTTAPHSASSTPAPGSSVAPTGPEPPRKKVKAGTEKENGEAAPDNTSAVPVVQPKKKPIVEKPVPPPPPPPEPPKAKTLPCAVCGQLDPLGDQHLACKECRMAVHRNCYGVVDNRSPSKWTCDMCQNDKNPQVSIQYKCMLCPVEHTEQDFVEPPRVSHKKKTEKERERDRVEREHAQSVADYFRRKQEEGNKPLDPREPLKRTANNNWYLLLKTQKLLSRLKEFHLYHLQDMMRYVKRAKSKVALVSIVTIVKLQNGFVLGFDITPVKGSRRDQTNIVSIGGENGSMSAAIWCKEHVPTKTIVHQMHDIIDDTGLNALQLYVQNFKQADLALTGTVRKATLVNQSTKAVNPVSASGVVPNRRTSTTGTSAGTNINRRASLTNVKPEEDPPANGLSPAGESERKCITCDVDVSPKWWPIITATAGSPSGPLDPVSDRNQVRSDSPHVTNGGLSNGPTPERPGGHVALAAAALHQNTQPLITEFQCHQCHWKKIRKEPTPIPAPPPIEREPSRPPPTLPPPTTAPVITSITQPEPELNHTPHQFPWPPPPPSYPPAPSYNPWPRQSPVPTNVPSIHHINGNHSPRITGSAQQLGHPPHTHPPVPGLQHSPHQNGRIPPMANGYPPSPHRSVGPPPPHLPNGTYVSYAATRPSPQHLTNGGPPPRAPEHPFPPSSAPMHHRPYGPPHGSPPAAREPLRENGPPQSNGVRPNDGRVNGGASASPSLRNLLS